MLLAQPDASSLVLMGPMQMIIWCTSYMAVSNSPGYPGYLIKVFLLFFSLLRPFSTPGGPPRTHRSVHRLEGD